MKITIEGEPKEIAALLVQAEARLIDEAAEKSIQRFTAGLKEYNDWMDRKLSNSST